MGSLLGQKIKLFPKRAAPTPSLLYLGRDVKASKVKQVWKSWRDRENIPKASSFLTARLPGCIISSWEANGKEPHLGVRQVPSWHTGNTA